jgi:hypothetical protein
MTPETETTEIILPEETVIPIPEPEPTLPTSSEAERFPVVRGLMIVGFILVALFGSIIVPKTISYLHLAKEEAPQFVPLPEIAAVTTARDPFADIVLEAEAAYVWDITAKKPLYEKNAEKSWPLASHDRTPVLRTGGRRYGYYYFTGSRRPTKWRHPHRG